MKFAKSLHLLQVHCQGEIGKVIMAGAPEILGQSLIEKMDNINQVDDSLRRFVTLEPRAHRAMSVNLLLEAVSNEADAGFIVLQADRAHPMSGSNCICVVTALLESGRLAMQDNETIVRLDTPAGLITTYAKCEKGRCVSVSLDNVPAFVEMLDHEIMTPDWGMIKIDVAYGGVYYALIDVEQIGLSIEPSKAKALGAAGMELKKLIEQQISVQHPLFPSINKIAYVMFRSMEADGAVRTCTTLEPGRVDRSPCGTGSSANLASLHARGLIKIGESKRSHSVINGEFVATVMGETLIGDKKAILPRITGSAWIYGKEELRIDDTDPFAQGFTLAE